MRDGATVKVRGKDELFKRLRASVPAVEKAVADANLKSANEIADMARRLVPVDEGDLRDSITVTGSGGTTPGGSQVPIGAAAISTNDFKARWVEYGTVNRGPQPFFRPAWHVNKKRAKGRVNRAVRQVLKKAGH